MRNQYTMKEVMEWLDHSQSLLKTVLSFVGEAREPLTEIEVEQLRKTLFLAMDVVIHIVRNASSIEQEAPADQLNSDEAPLLPDEVMGQFANISATLVQINNSLESRYITLN